MYYTCIDVYFYLLNVINTGKANVAPIVITND